MTSKMTERVQTVLLLTGLAAVAAAVGVVVAGATGLTLALAGVATVWFVAPQVPNAWILRAVGARSLHPWEAPDLFEIRDALVRRAGLAAAPGLHVLMERRPQAFTLGERDDAAIVLSTGLLRTLSRRELTGVLAHELSHVVHDDIRLLRFASTLTNATAALSRAALLTAIIGLPLILLGALRFNPLAFLAIVAAPGLAQVLLLALSRAREHAADAGAARLTGDPEGLASALARLEAHGQSFWHRLLGLPTPTAPSWFHTHPATTSRIRRLMGGASSRTSREAARGVNVGATRPRRARFVVRRGPRTTILRAA